MTLVLTAMTPRYVVQAADRLLTKGAAVHDAMANKTIIYRTRDGVMVLSYSGIAYLSRQPMDEWIAEQLWGDAIGRGPDGCGPAAMMMGQRPNNWTIDRSEEHTSELQSLMRISYAVFCLKQKKYTTSDTHNTYTYITLISI